VIHVRFDADQPTERVHRAELVWADTQVDQRLRGCHMAEVFKECGTEATRRLDCTLRPAKRAPDRHQPRSGALLGLLEEPGSYACVASGASVAAVRAVSRLLPPLNAK
jgi:hypothetical protein